MCGRSLLLVDQQALRYVSEDPEDKEVTFISSQNVEMGCCFYWETFSTYLMAMTVRRGKKRKLGAEEHVPN